VDHKRGPRITLAEIPRTLPVGIEHHNLIKTVILQYILHLTWNLITIDINIIIIVVDITNCVYSNQNNGFKFNLDILKCLTVPKGITIQQII
jgi:hypothetical protein